MAISDQTPSTYSAPSGEVPCTYHRDVLTRLRCSRCGKPICPKESVRTPVGLRCPECAGVRGLPTYRTESSSLLKATAYGLLIAMPVAILWGFFPQWQFYLALVLGFGVAEAMARAANFKRGRDLQLMAMLIVLGGLALSRYVIIQRFDIPWEIVNDFSPALQGFLYLQLLPDLLFAAIPLILGWIRFR